jgi:hypothetical protein
MKLYYSKAGVFIIDSGNSNYSVIAAWLQFLFNTSVLYLFSTYLSYRSNRTVFDRLYYCTFFCFPEYFLPCGGIELIFLF